MSDDVLQQSEEMQRVGGRGQEIELLVVAPGSFIFGVDRQGANSGDVCSLKSSGNCVFQQRSSDALSVPTVIDGEPSQQHDGDGMASESLLQAIRRIRVAYLTYGKTVKADDPISRKAEIGGGGVGRLVLQGVLNQPAIEVGLPAVKGIEHVVSPELFDASSVRHLLAFSVKEPRRVEESLQPGQRSWRGVQC